MRHRRPWSRLSARSTPARPRPLPALRSRTAFLLAVLLAAPALTASAADEVRTLDGERSVKVRSIAVAGGALAVVTEEGRIDGATVREIRFGDATPVTDSVSAWLFLRTGEAIPGSLAEATDIESVALRSPTLGRLEVPLDLVAAVALTADPRAIERFRRQVVPEEPDEDRVVLTSWESQHGMVDSIGPDGIVLISEALGEVTLGAERALGVRLQPLTPLPDPPAGPRAELELTCGATVSGRLVGLTEGHVRFDTAYAEGLRVPRRQVAAISLQSDRFAYLSDLDPVEVEERADLIDIVFEHRRDASVTGGPLRVDGSAYRKGLGVHAFTRLTYDLDGGFDRFRAVIGLDDTTRARRDVVGTVTFQVLVDGEPALSAEGVTLSSAEGARPIDVPLSGARRLELVADFGPSGDVLSRGVWADAHLIR